ncbi:MAG TPA: alpha-ketoglutarate-dependent dioxygenase AlkB, partial [Kofleriaceae bacterium]|nr:alpha-ketoglutarate-dependent dioxygenase AlkB [Kofleriaceae bacterium]
LGKGRRGTVLVERDGESAVPIVRTTTQYRAPAQLFLEVHRRIADDIRDRGSLSCAFNNALIEHYTNVYSTMKRHSDQALDLADGSWIAIYSCYRDPGRPSRRLVVTSKEPGGATFDIPLSHGGVVAFSLDTNRRFTHTIALCERAPDNDWLGLTFRTSKTYVRVVDGQPCFANGERLTLASEEQRRELFQLRRRENAEATFTYPSITYTISESDLSAPGSCGG